MQATTKSAADLGLTDDKVAFSDALGRRTLQTMGDGRLKFISPQLITHGRKSVTIDCTSP